MPEKMRGMGGFQGSGGVMADRPVGSRRGRRSTRDICAQIKGAQRLAGGAVSQQPDRDQRGQRRQPRHAVRLRDPEQRVLRTGQRRRHHQRGADHPRHAGAELRVEPELAAPRQHHAEAAPR